MSDLDKAIFWRVMCCKNCACWIDMLNQEPYCNVSGDETDCDHICPNYIMRNGYDYTDFKMKKKEGE